MELEDQIGFFVNSLVLRTDLSCNPSFKELLARVRHTVLEAYEHQELRFERLVADLSPLRDLTRHPLSAISFVLQNLADLELDLVGADLKPIPVHTGTTKSEVSLSLLERDGALQGTLEYSTDLFDAETMRRLAKHFVRLLGSAVAAPDTKIGELPLLDAEEREQIIVRWNATHREYPLETGMPTLFEQQVGRTPDAIAVRLRDETLTYRVLNARTNELANRLRELGVAPDVPVGVCLERSIDLVVAILAVLKAGGAYVPLDPEYPTSRLL